MPAVAVAAPEIAFVAILFICFMAYALAFYLRNMTADIVLVGGALAAACDWILDRIGELIVTVIQFAANMILSFVSFWHSFVNGIITPFVSYVTGILADFNFWIEYLKTTVAPAAIAARDSVAGLLTRVGTIESYIASSLVATINDIRNTLLAVKAQQFVDEATLGSLSQLVAQIVGVGVLSLPTTIIGLAQRITSNEQLIVQQAAQIAQLSQTLAIDGATLIELRNRLAAQQAAIDSVIAIGAVTALGAEAVQTVAKLAKNPCLCFEPDMDMGWMVPVVIGLATDTL